MYSREEFLEKEYMQKEECEECEYAVMCGSYCILEDEENEDYLESIDYFACNPDEY